MGQRDSYLRRLKGDLCVADAARLALASATGVVFADSKAFDTWWPANSDTHHHLWYWIIRWRATGGNVEADLPAVVDAFWVRRRL